MNSAKYSLTQSKNLRPTYKYAEFSWQVDYPTHRLNAISPQNSYVNILTPNVMILGAEALKSNQA